ncbi:MAG: hypothetical protein P8X74_24145, partial [Reinekea sp.]
MHVDSILGLPNQINWQAVTLDAVLRVAQPVARDDNSSAEKNFMQLAALQGSILEHKVFESLLLTDSISADKGLQLAREQSIPVLTLDRGNFESLRTSLTHPDNVINEIENWVSQGYRVSTPTSSISRNQWQGHVWQVEDPVSNSGGYYIAGGLAGGSTTVAADSWVLDWMRDALSAANTPPPKLNPGEAASISILTHTIGQTGIVGQALD